MSSFFDRRIDRRAFMLQASRAALLGAGGASQLLLGAGAAQAAPAFEAYHGVSPGAHQSNFNRLSGQGYRMMSLSVYGTPLNERYAAVWVRRDGPAWGAVHGLNAVAYQAAFDSWTSKGYAPYLVSATGTGANAIFAAAFEKGFAGGWKARHGLTAPEYDA
jgi:hypothetical protein